MNGTEVDVWQSASRSGAVVMRRLGSLGGTIESHRNARSRIFWITAFMWGLSADSCDCCHGGWRQWMFTEASLAILQVCVTHTAFSEVRILNVFQPFQQQTPWRIYFYSFSYCPVIGFLVPLVPWHSFSPFSAAENVPSHAPTYRVFHKRLQRSLQKCWWLKKV